MSQLPRVHVLYRRPEIPANTANPAFVVSVTCRKRWKAANPDSTPASATNSFAIIDLRRQRRKLELGERQKMGSGARFISIRALCRRP